LHFSLAVTALVVSLVKANVNLDVFIEVRGERVPHVAVEFGDGEVQFKMVVFA